MVRLAIHGGAGGDGPWKGPSDLDPQRVACMHKVLSTVGSMLESGIDAIEAVTLAVEMMEDDGWEIEVRNVEDIETIMNEYNIPDDKRSCHLSLVEGYYVVGHVPFEIIDQLIEEKPDIDGISLPGMPAGSPGMGGEKSETWTIYSIKDGESEVFAEY